MQIGKYELLKKIATGGMAEVFLARAAGPKGFQKLLVLKRILPHLAEDPAFVDMFLSEAKLAAQFSHPNIVQIFDFGEVDNTSFIAMEFVDGPNLRALQARALDFGTPLPFGVCAKIISLACEGLAYAHDFVDPQTGQPLGVVHRDISPDNVLVSRNGYVKVVDFGIAKAATQSHKTRTGTIKGKLAYMPPEQLQNQPLDRRTDVFALGMVLYELVTGTKPFDGSSEASALKAILFEPFIPAVSRRADLPRELARIIERALAKEREQRYQSCRELQAELERFIHTTGEPVGTLQVGELVASLALPNLAADLQGTPAPRPLATPGPAPAPLGTGWGYEATAARAPSAPQTGQRAAPEPTGQRAAAPRQQPTGQRAAVGQRTGQMPAPEPMGEVDPAAFAATTARASPLPEQMNEPTAPLPVQPSMPERAERQGRVERAEHREREEPLPRASRPRWIPAVAVIGVLLVAAVGGFVFGRSGETAKAGSAAPVADARQGGPGEARDPTAEKVAVADPKPADAVAEKPAEGSAPQAGTAQPEPGKSEPGKSEPGTSEPEKSEPEPEPERSEPEPLPGRITERNRREKRPRKRDEQREVAKRDVETETKEPEKVEQAPADEPARDFDSYIQEGTKLVKRGKAEAALELFTKAAAMEPKRPEAPTGQGWAYLGMRKPAEAEQAFKRALKIDRNRGPALMGLARAYRALGKEDAAIRLFERYLELHPDGPMAREAEAALDN